MRQQEHYRLVKSDNLHVDIDFKDKMSQIVASLKRSVISDAKNSYKSLESVCSEYLIIADNYNGGRNLYNIEYRYDKLVLISLYDDEVYEFPVDISAYDTYLYYVIDKQLGVKSRILRGERLLLRELSHMIVKKVIENELLSYGEAWECFELAVDNNEMISLRCEREKDYSVFPSLILYDDYRNRIIKHYSMRREIFSGMKVRQLIAHTSDGDIVKVYPADWEGFVIPRSNRYVSTDGRKEYKVSDLWFLDARSLEVNSYF